MLCPHQCKVNRLEGERGICNASNSFHIASITLHHGEEPVISGENGICNVFFSHCNLQCMYCQNYQISSRNCKLKAKDKSLFQIINEIISILDKGVENLGFVSPTHLVPQMLLIIDELNSKGYHPVIVFNSNAYDSVQVLQMLEGKVDVYLPDFKYSDPALALKWSGVTDYPEKAIASIKEMYRQTGNKLIINENGKAERGLIIRHLVLPGEVENSLGVLRIIAEHLSERISVSLMSQYHPIPRVSGEAKLGRTLAKAEYQTVVEEMEKLGFMNGWVQEHDSHDYYNPDFSSDSPFPGSTFQDPDMGR